MYKRQGLSKYFKDLSKEHVAVGHFQSQGKHTTGLYYTEMMNGYAVGGLGDYEVRNPMAIIKSRPSDFIKGDTIESKLKEFIGRAVREKGMSPDKASQAFLKGVGIEVRENYRKLFNKISFPYMPPDSSNTPLWETGELASKAAYRTSKNPRTYHK